jgi:hypothetical protein
MLLRVQSKCRKRSCSESSRLQHGLSWKRDRVLWGWQPPSDVSIERSDHKPRGSELEYDYWDDLFERSFQCKHINRFFLDGLCDKPLL